MREHAHIASRRRDERLALIRKLTLWVTGGAAAASLGLGAAFAHAVPGHAASTPASSGSARQTSSAGTSHAASGGTGTTPHSQNSQLVQPQQQPTQTTAPPVVTSGGS